VLEHFNVGKDRMTLNFPPVLLVKFGQVSNNVWPDTLRKTWKALHFIVLILKRGNNKTKHLAYTALVRPILEYRAGCWDPCREDKESALNRVQNRAAKFANNINESG
jgi:hypothetical protein